MSFPSERFFLAQDESCHWYIVPEANRAEWQAWASIPTDDERSWNVPEFAKPIDSPQGVTFCDPR